MASAPSTSVKVVEVVKVIPSPPPPPEKINSVSLTFYDAFWLRCPSSQILTFYEASKPNHSIISELKQSLSTALHHYFFLAGKLTWPSHSTGPIIRYVQGDAVSLIVAEADASDFHRLADPRSSAGFVEAVEYHPFVPDLSSTDEEATLMTLQVTMFGDKGISIGYATHHAALDGISASKFMHSWASLCREKDIVRGNLNPELTPFHDRTIVKDPKDRLTTALSTWLEKNGPNNKSLALEEAKTLPDVVRGGTFVLSRVNIDYIKSLILAQWQKKHGKLQDMVRLSSFTATIAYVWACLVRSRYEVINEVNSNDKFYLILSVDERHLLEDTKDSTYFGNCVTIRTVELSLSELSREDNVAEAAKAIGEAIKGPECEAILMKAMEQAGKRLGAVIGISGSPRMKLYDIDFGWGRPKSHVMVSTDQNGALFLTESRDGDGGLEIALVLKKEEMEYFASLFASGLRDP